MKPYFLAVTALLIFSAGAAGLAVAQNGKACLGEKWPPKQLRCLDDAAKAAGSAAPCLLTDEAALRWQCVARQAERAGKVETCKLLPEVAVEKGELSRDLCKAHLAIAWGKSALCAELVTPNLGDACILQLVQRGGEKTLCGKIVNAHLKTACADVSKP